MSKTVKIKVLSGCRVDGKSLLPGKSYSVSEEGAKLVCGARRAVYETATKVTAKKQNSRKQDEPAQEEPAPESSEES